VVVAAVTAVVCAVDQPRSDGSVSCHRLLRSATASIEDTRARLEEDRQQFERMRHTHEQEAVESRMMAGAGSETENLRAILREVRGQLRDAEELAAAKTRLLEKRGVELSSLREQLELLQRENDTLEAEVRHVTRQAGKKAEQGAGPRPYRAA
jgi:chromosome segregation ATPase